MKTTRKHSPEAETQVPEDGSFVEQVKKEAERIKQENQRAQAERDSQRNLENKTTELDLTPPSGVKSPESIKKKSRTKIAALLSAGVISIGAAGTGAYAYITQQGPFAPEQKQEKNEFVENTVEKTRTTRPEMPDEVRTNQDLQNALKSQNIFADAVDFDFPSEKPQLHARALSLKINSDSDTGTTENLGSNSVGIGYEWVPVTRRVTELAQNEVIIAIRVVNRYVMEDAQSLLQPKGFNFRAKAVDPEDPSITYFYYNCADKENPNILAQIGLQDPTNPRKLLWARSFDIPACE